MLEVSEAFKTLATLDDQGQLQVTVDIAPGYFLYRSKIAVHSEHASFGPLDIPPGTKKQDQFFGEVETYRDQLQYTAAISNSNDSDPLTVTVISQGCADIGICYPPYSKDFSLAANQTLANHSSASASTTVAESASTNGLNTSTLGIEPANQDLMDPSAISNSGLLKTLGTDSTAPMQSSAGASTIGSALRDRLSLDTGNDVLDPEVAFTIDPTNIYNGVIPLKWNVAEGHYLYKKRFSFELLDPDNASLGDATFSEAIWEEDAFFGKSEVYRGSANVELPITLPANTTATTLKVGYQGCADAGICYPPTFKEINLVEISAVASAEPGNTLAAVSNAGTDGGGTGVASTTQSSTTGNTPGNTPVAYQSEQDRLANILAGDNFWLTIGIFFGAGLILTFTPCVLPMIPILSSIIVGSGEKTSAGRAFTLSLVYVLAMALTYTVAGVLVGLSGENIQATLQHPYVLTAFAFLFVLLSLSMFGFYELQMPAFIQNRLSSVSNKQKGGSYGGVATMGFLSALIVGPCITAPLVGALIYIGQTGDAVLGGAALFALSMGMGLPLLIIGTTFGKYMPRAGAWMDITKAFFGVMLLGLAIYMLDRVIPVWATMLLSALLLVTVGMFMGAFDSLPEGTRGWRKVTKGFGYAAVVYGTLLMIGVATGSGTLLRPIQGLSIAGGNNHGESASATEHVTFKTVKSVEQLNVALADARSKNQPVMLDFYADWCISCKEMEAFTFTDPKVASQLKQGVLLQADVTANDDLDKGMLKEFGIFGPPAIIFYDRQGVQQKSLRVVGYMPADEFSDVLARTF